MRRLFTNTTFDFIGVRRYAYILTAAFFLPGLVLLLVRGLNYGIEFTGGTLVQVESKAPIAAASLRHALDTHGLTGAEIQSFGSDREYVIRARMGGDEGKIEDSEATVAAVRASLDATLQPGQYEIVRHEAVGPKVGGELRQKALLATLLSFAAILVYLAIRFEWRFGLAAIGATAHDVLGTIMFISLMRLEVSLVIVGAVLSVLGLSLNETLPRTVLTHGTTLSTMATLAIFGGEVIRPFAFVMFFGVFTGIFSSMFIAPVVLMYIRQRWPVEGGARVAPTGAKRPAPVAVRAPRVGADGD